MERVLDTFERDHGDVRVMRLRPGFIFKQESASLLADAGGDRRAL